MEKYMFLFIGGDPSHLSPEKQEAHMAKWFAWVEKLQKADRYASGEALLPGGKTIKGSKKTVTDGPFTETKEQLGGIMVLEANDLNHAIQLMSSMPCMRIGGSLEIRPINEELSS